MKRIKIFVKHIRMRRYLDTEEIGAICYTFFYNFFVVNQ